MQIQIISDIHCEFHQDLGAELIRKMPVLADTLVLAGDLLPMTAFSSAAMVFDRLCKKFRDVIYVPGNHEYYKTSPAKADAVIRKCSEKFSGLHVLNPGTVTIGGVRFVGAALWFPLSKGDERYYYAMSDFVVIKGFVPWVYKTHAEHLKYLSETVASGDVVVTHHLPHPACVPMRYRSSPLNRFFVAHDAAELVEKAGAKLWIHGHTHDLVDCVVGETRIVCNPHGYPHERRPSLFPEKPVVVEV